MFYYLHSRQTPTIKIKLVTSDTDNPIVQMFKVDALCFGNKGPVKKEEALCNIGTVLIHYRKSI